MGRPSETGVQPASLRLSVSCYAGHRGEETPRSFRLGSREVSVADILDRWRGPDHRYFKVRSTEGDRYILRHNIVEEYWELTLFVTAGTAE